MKAKFAQFFVSTAVGILFVTGVAKIISAATGGPALQSFDPIFGITLRHLFWMVGLLEVVIALVCLFNRRLSIQTGLLLWLAANFLVYRLGLMLVGGPKYCSCLGTLTGALKIGPSTANSAMIMILIYLFIGSCIGYLWIRKQNRNVACSTLQLG